MTTELTLAEAKRLAHEVVAEMGEDYVYAKRDEHGFPLPEGMDQNDIDDHDRYGIDPACRYVHKDYAEDGQAVVMTPGCIVGRILHKAGVDLGRFEGHEGTIAAVILTNLDDTGDIRVHDPLVGQYLSCIQGLQDEGTTYGRAVEAGDDRF